MTHYVETVHPSYKGPFLMAQDLIDRWSGLSNLSRFLLETNTLSDLMERTARSVTEILDMDFCRVLILEMNGHYYCRTAYYRNPSIISRRNDLPEPLAAEQIYQRIASSKPSLVPYRPEEIVNQNDLQSISNQKDSIWLVPLSANSQDLGFLILGKNSLKKHNEYLIESTHFVELIAGQLSNAIFRIKLNNRLSDNTLEIVQALTKALEVRDIDSGLHSQHMANYSNRLAHLLGCSEKEALDIYWAALLHDIGKIGVEDQILRKPGPLSQDEWKIMRRHPEIGAKIVQGMTGLDRVAPIILMHHERIDGSGYPKGLKNGQISLGARIIAVVDSYTAMTEGRPYRERRSKGEAIDELNRLKGTTYDTKVVDTFVRMLQAEL